MATSVSISIADADLARIVNAITSPSQLQAGSVAPLYPPAGATSSAVVKAYVIGVLQTATVLFEQGGGQSTTSAAPAIT